MLPIGLVPKTGRLPYIRSRDSRTTRDGMQRSLVSDQSEPKRVLPSAHARAASLASSSSGTESASFRSKVECMTDSPISELRVSPQCVEEDYETPPKPSRCGVPLRRRSPRQRGPFCTPVLNSEGRKRPNLQFRQGKREPMRGGEPRFRQSPFPGHREPSSWRVAARPPGSTTDLLASPGLFGR